MQLQDDRTDEERASHTWLVIGTDKFLSGWGKAANGPSFTAWACMPEDRKEVLEWMEGRSDMLRVREMFESSWGEVYRYRPRGPGHCHIYVVGPDHPSVASKYERSTT